MHETPHVGGCKPRVCCALVCVVIISAIATVVVLFNVYKTPPSTDSPSPAPTVAPTLAPSASPSTPAPTETPTTATPSVAPSTATPSTATPSTATPSTATPTATPTTATPTTAAPTAGGGGILSDGDPTSSGATITPVIAAVIGICGTLVVVGLAVIVRRRKRCGQHNNADGEESVHLPVGEGRGGGGGATRTDTARMLANVQRQVKRDSDATQGGGDDEASVFIATQNSRAVNRPPDAYAWIVHADEALGLADAHLIYQARASAMRRLPVQSPVSRSELSTGSSRHEGEDSEADAAALGDWDTPEDGGGDGPNAAQPLLSIAE